MKPFVAFLLSLIPCLSFAFNGSQQIYFDKIQAGLSHQTVFTILQDKTGFLWFGTKDGLNRYDGVNFKTYYRSNYSKLGNSCITCLTEDINGEIWCGTDCGIFVYNPIKDIFRHIPININGKRIPDKTVQIIKEDRKHGVIYIAMDNFGLLRYSLKDGSLREMNINAVFYLSTMMVLYTWDFITTVSGIGTESRTVSLVFRIVRTIHIFKMSLTIIYLKVPMERY